MNANQVRSNQFNVRMDFMTIGLVLLAIAHMLAFFARL